MCACPNVPLFAIDRLEFLTLWTQSVAESEVRTFGTLRLCGSRVVGMNVVGIGRILNVILFVCFVTTDLCSLEQFEVCVCDVMLVPVEGTKM